MTEGLQQPQDHLPVELSEKAKELCDKFKLTISRDGIVFNPKSDRPQETLPLPKDTTRIRAVIGQDENLTIYCYKGESSRNFESIILHVQGNPDDPELKRIELGK